MAESIVKYPIGIQSFENIRMGEYLYIDKTAFIYQLTTKGKYYFLSRPRRFGKSLLLNTMKAYFEGRKELFEGLALGKLEDKWESYPVIMLSLAGYNPSDENSLEEILSDNISRFEEEYAAESNTNNLSLRFRNIIRAAFEKTGKRVVILVDEYDAPMVAHIGEESKHEKVRNLLKSVYSNLKDMDDYIKFGMLTGVSKFSKMTIFSGLNNLIDISMLPQYADICGITEGELRCNFQEGITELAASLNIDIEEAFQLLKDNYDGYHFTEDCPDLYNPFSLLNAVNNLRIRAYWFESGSPTFLIKLLKHHRASYWELFNQTASELALSEIDTYIISPVSLLFQTGYLTIKDYDKRRRRYKLGIPNKEVEEGLFTRLLSATSAIAVEQVETRMWDIRDAFTDGNPALGLDIIQSIFAGIPPALSKGMPEIYYENNLYMLFMLVGLDARAEWWTSDGRIDMLLEVAEYVYVMELKLGGTPEKALEQIDTKNYALQWKHDGRKIFKIGISYSKTSRNIDRWIIKE